jgi:hypothetical protein
MMRKFTKIVAPALFATLALGAVVPAQAQNHDRHDQRYDNGRSDNGRYNAGRPTPGRDNQIRADINNLNRSIDRAIARRTISNREATGLRRDATEIQRLYTQYARNGLTQTEQRTLRNRVDRIESTLRNERRDNDNRRR